MKTDRILGMLGLAARARQLTVGSNLSCDAIAHGAPLALCASDASDNTKKRMSDRCKFYGCGYSVLPHSSEELGRAIGKAGSVAAVAVTDQNFASALENLLSLQNNENI